MAAWSVPLLVDGRRAAVTGWEWYAAAPSLVPWIAAAAVLLAAAGGAVAYGSRSAHRALAAALLPVSVGAWLAGWIGILLYGTPSPLVIALAVAYAAVTVLLVLAAVTATHGNGRMAAAGMVGALAAVFTVPEVEAFTRGFVFSSLGATLARAAALVSFAGGIALAAACVPAMADILSDDPLRRRLLAHTIDDDLAPSRTGARVGAWHRLPTVDRRAAHPRAAAIPPSTVQEFHPCQPRLASQSAVSLPPASSR